jgi:hypothetical protein
MKDFFQNQIVQYTTQLNNLKNEVSMYNIEKISDDNIKTLIEIRIETINTLMGQLEVSIANCQARLDEILLSETRAFTKEQMVIIDSINNTYPSKYTDILASFINSTDEAKEQFFTLYANGVANGIGEVIIIKYFNINSIINDTFYYLVVLFYLFKLILFFLR